MEHLNDRALRKYFNVSIGKTLGLLIGLSTTGCSTYQSSPDTNQLTESPTADLVLKTASKSSTNIEPTPPDIPVPSQPEVQTQSKHEDIEQQALPEGISQNWLANAQKYIRESEYHIKPYNKPEGVTVSGSSLFQAPNRAHNLRTYFEEDGIRVIPRDGKQDWEWGLTLKGYGAPDNIKSAIKAAKKTSNGRIEYQRGNITEWYVNDRKGLEQGFTIQEAPKDSAGNKAKKVNIEIEITGDLTAHLNNNKIIFSHPVHGHTLNYDTLIAWDADGAALEANFSLVNNTLVISTNTVGAKYPIVIDPLTTAGNIQTIAGKIGEFSFGTSVSSAGDVNGDGYTDIIIGAQYYDFETNDEGAAFVFSGSTGGVIGSSAGDAVHMLRANQQLAWFGASVGSGDINGDGYSDVFVGAQLYDETLSDEGAVFVYLGSASGVTGTDTNTADFKLVGNQQSANFGVSLSSAGDVNADGYEDIIVGTSGSLGKFVHIYHGSATGIVDNNLATPALIDPSRILTSSVSFYGESVSNAGDVNADGYSDIIIGSRLGGVNGKGRAYIYHGSASGVANFIVAQFESISNGSMGSSVSTAGDFNGDGYDDVLIGASGAKAAYLYSGKTITNDAIFGQFSGTPANAYSIITSDQTTIAFPSSIANAGDVNGDGFSDIIIGQETYDNGTCTSPYATGAAFVFLGSLTRTPTIDTSEADAIIQTVQASSVTGASVAAAGDLDNDGYADILISAPNHAVDFNSELQGAVFVLYGSSTGISTGVISGSACGAVQNFGGIFNTEVKGFQNNAVLGASVALAGDVNGDGYGDIVIGAPGYDNGQTNEGIALVYHGTSPGITATWPPDANTLIESNQVNALFGIDVASAGDVNGDGFSDIIIGAPYDNDGVTTYGSATIFHGSAAGITGTSPLDADTRIINTESNDSFAEIATTAGDVNGDGYDDILIANPRYDNNETNEGIVYLFHGSSAGVVAIDETDAITAIESNQPFSRFGNSAATAGDVNGDGYYDIVVGANQYDNGETDEGAAFIFHGSSSGITASLISQADAIIESNQIDSELGFAVSTAGDVNADSYDDIIVTATYYDGNIIDEGAAFIFHGSSSGITGTSPATADTIILGGRGIPAGQTSPVLFGYSAASAGDINQDGYADVIIGSLRYQLFLDGTGGAAFTYLGSDSGVDTDINLGFYSEQDAAQFGISVSSAGDINGDGFSDIIIGANASGINSEGAAFIFEGNNGITGSAIRLRPKKTSPGGPAFRRTSNILRVWYTTGHPDGSGKVKQEIEACPNGVKFDDPACTIKISDNWTDVSGLPFGVLLDDEITNLPEGPYRWRARALYAPAGIDIPGITAPSDLRHSPWHRYNGQAGNDYIYLIIDTNGDGIPDNIPPIISGNVVDPTIVSPNQLYLLSPTASDRNANEVLTFTITGDGITDKNDLPSWLGFDNSTGVLTGTPSDSDYNSSHNLPLTNLVITVTDNGGLSASLPAFDLFVEDVKAPNIITNTTIDSLTGDVTYSLTCFDAGSACAGAIYYTLDGSTPTTSSSVYTGPITVPSGTTVLAYAEDNEGNSAVVPANFITINTPYNDFIGTNSSIDGFIDETFTSVATVNIQVYGYDGSNSTALVEEGGSQFFKSVPPASSDLSATVDNPMDEWSYTKTVPWVNDVDYTITATATDINGNSSTVSSAFTFYNGAPAATTLQLSLTSNAILNNGEIDATLTLTNLNDPNDDLTGTPVILHITDPDGIHIDINASTNISGNVVIPQLGDGSFGVTFNKSGAWTLQAEFDNTDGTGSVVYPNLASVTSDPENLLVNTSAGYAIIVQGKLPGNNDIAGLASHNKTANRIYQTFKNRGLVDNDIFYYNFDTLQVGVDDIPSKAVIQAAIENLANTIQQRPAPVYIVMVDHGGKANMSLDTHFFVDTEIIEPSDVSLWLTNLENNMDALDTQLALDNPRVVIVGACYSGGFIDQLSASNRVIITSATDYEQSFKGPIEDDNVRVGEYFLEELFIELDTGNNLRDAFRLATVKTETYTKEFSGDVGINSGNEFLDTAIQHPLLDDDGLDGGTNDLYENTSDGQLAKTIVLGLVPDSIANSALIPAAITSVSAAQYLADGDNDADLTLFANDIFQVNQAYVEIRSPGQVLAIQPDTVTEQQTSDYDRRAFIPPAAQGGAYTLTYSAFTAPGKYELYHYVNDRYTNKLSPAVRSLVYKDSASNTDYPTAFDLQSPGNNATIGNVVGFDWQDASDADGLTYTLMIADDAAFTTFTHLDDSGSCSVVGNVYVQEELTSSSTYTDGSAGLCDYASGDGYFWKVIAVDSFGRTTESTSTFYFATDTPANASAVMITTLKSIQTNQLLVASNVAGDQVINNFGEQASSSIIYNGQLVILTINPGMSQTVTAQIPGFSDVVVNVAGTDIEAGESVELLFNMPSFVDSDGDGMPDDYETANGLNPLVDDASLDPDGDTLTNLQEYQNGTDPNSVDTDGDGLNDNVDPNPLVPDTAAVYGDVAPTPSPDGILNGADLLIMQRMALGEITPNAMQLINGDIYPVSTPDGVINTQDLILLQQVILQ